MPRNTNGLKRGGSPGRVPGVPNKATKTVKSLSAKLLSDPAYVESLKVRLRRGTAGPVEPLLWHYAYGKPKETTELTGKDGEPLMLVKWLRGADGA